jgi:SAM-dependent methyltransferase
VNNLLTIAFQQRSLRPSVLLNNLKAYRLFLDDLKVLQAQQGSLPDFPITKYYPQLHNRGETSGTMSGHYFHQDLLVAQRIFLNAPVRHVDVGSRTDGFVAHVAAFRSIEVFDIRPLHSTVANISFMQADMMQLPNELIECTDSLSCLHTIEHFGLGRYGDPVRVNGHLEGLDSLYQMLKPGGKFYLATPIGPQRIEFNAHRVFNVDYLLRQFQDRYELDHFSYVDDAGDLHKHVPLPASEVARNFGCEYGCGIFELTKNKN